MQASWERMAEHQKVDSVTWRWQPADRTASKSFHVIRVGVKFLMMADLEKFSLSATTLLKVLQFISDLLSRNAKHLCYVHVWTTCH